MSRNSRRVHTIIVTGGPMTFAIGGPPINGKALWAGQRFNTHHEKFLHELEVIDPVAKVARWVRVVGPAPPPVRMPTSP